jgi:hypothetical protein
MARRTAAELAIAVTSSAADAIGDFDAVGDAATRMSSHVAAAGDDMERTSRQIGITADSADELGGKAGKATGALGALSSGFELVGAEKYAGALQGAGLATDFLSGVGDSLNLVMESTIVKTARARIAAVGHGIATGAQAVATSVMTGAQWALNAALNANPVALIVLGIIALTAAVIIAYKKSETFRRIVDAAFRAVQAAASFAFGWVKNNWPLLLAIITGPIGLAVLAVVKNWDKIQAAASATKKWITDRMREIPDAIAGFAQQVEDIITAPFDAAIDLIDSIVDKIKKIHLPDLNPLNRVSGTGGGFITSTGTSQQVTTGPTYEYTFNLNGLITDDEAGAVIQQLLDRNARLFRPAGA